MLDRPPEYLQRRAELTELATGLDGTPAHIDYLESENATWAKVVAELHPLWDRHACSDILTARASLELPTDRIPQLAEVNAALADLTGVRFAAVDGILPGDEFFDALARSMFPSTQYIRWGGAPDYTPEPDILHEVLGHGTALACPELAELHRLAGAAVGNLETPEAVQMVADTFWFSAEFGVVHDPTDPDRSPWKAYGAGLLSSPGELAWFGDHAEIRPIDIVEMVTTDYEIDHYQPVLFGASSLQHLLDVVGGFFVAATDEIVDRFSRSRVG